MRFCPRKLALSVAEQRGRGIRALAATGLNHVHWVLTVGDGDHGQWAGNWGQQFLNPASLHGTCMLEVADISQPATEQNPSASF